MAVIKCAECGGTNIRKARGLEIYPHRPDLKRRKLWLCECGAYCGAHPDWRPYGRPAGHRTRQARMAAHAVFDDIWKSGEMARGEAYAWLASQMHISPDDCHIGMMGADDAFRVRDIVLQRRLHNG
jgi:hypothetical protein